MLSEGRGEKVKFNVNNNYRTVIIGAVFVMHELFSL